MEVEMQLCKDIHNVDTGENFDMKYLKIEFKK